MDYFFALICFGSIIILFFLIPKPTVFPSFIKSDAQQSRLRKVFGVSAVAAFILLGKVASFTNNDHIDPEVVVKTKEVPRSISTSTQAIKKDIYKGEEGYLVVPGSDKVYLFSTKEVLDEYSKALSIGDKYAILDIINRGDVFVVKDKTKILVLDYSVWSAASKVRILNGDQEGRAGWTLSTFITDK